MSIDHSGIFDHHQQGQGGFGINTGGR